MYTSTVHTCMVLCVTKEKEGHQYQKREKQQQQRQKNFQLSHWIPNLLIHYFVLSPQATVNNLVWINCSSFPVWPNPRVPYQPDKFSMWNTPLQIRETSEGGSIKDCYHESQETSENQALDMTFLCLPRFWTLRCSVRSISSLWFHFRSTEKNTEKGKKVKGNYQTFEKKSGDQKKQENNSKTLWYSAYTLYRKGPNKRPGVYSILGVQTGAFNRYKAFILITWTTSTKLICFRQKYQESLKIAEHPLHQSIRLGRLGIHTALLDSNIYAKIVAQGYCVAIVSLSLLWN